MADDKNPSGLETQEHARLLVISDSHGNADVVRAILQNFGKTCDALIFCGDGISDVSSLLSEDFMPPVVAAVRGNCDPLVSADLSSGFEQTLCVNGHKILIVHGNAHGVDYGTEKLALKMKFGGYDTAFYGHTHIAAEETAGNFKFVNPGSCARPRGGQPPSFAIATVEKDFIDIAFLNASTFSLWTPLS